MDNVNPNNQPIKNDTQKQTWFSFYKKQSSQKVPQHFIALASAVVLWAVLGYAFFAQTMEATFYVLFALLLIPIGLFFAIMGIINSRKIADESKRARAKLLSIIALVINPIWFAIIRILIVGEL
jgi:hypothetical protein